MTKTCRVLGCFFVVKDTPHPLVNNCVCQTHYGHWALVTLFKPNGKYYLEECWRIPENAIGPYDMKNSNDFRRISNGPVLVETQEPWGYPHLFPSPDMFGETDT